ncbi:MAG: hypothetical protein HY043_04240 [Verrucomicrobia bacterium]|nr:hypothetical protein [Verrucomicrobiota bacterium]
MAGNRRNQAAAIWFAPALKAFLLCLFFGGSGVGYVWQQNQIKDLGRQIKLRESRRDQLLKENKQYRDEFARACSPVELDRRVKKHPELGLAAPAFGKILRLVDAAPATEPRGNERHFAGN